MDFKIDEIFGRGESCVALENMAESRVAHIEMSGNFGHRGIGVYRALHVLFCKLHDVWHLAIWSEVSVGFGHKHKTEKVVYYAGQKLLEEGALSYGNVGSFAVKALYGVVCADMVERLFAREEACGYAVVDICPLEADPMLSPARFGVGAVCVPLGGENQEHIACFDGVTSCTACLQLALSFGNLEELVLLEGATFTPIEEIFGVVATRWILLVRCYSLVTCRADYESPAVVVFVLGYILDLLHVGIYFPSKV